LKTTTDRQGASAVGVDSRLSNVADSQATPAETSAWMVSPLFDLLFFANIGWVVLLIPAALSVTAVESVEFWQIYFITTPHRWITLLLVATDPDRRGGRTALFLLIAAVTVAIVFGARLVGGAFVCLAMIDLVWNGWHFASQHAGILRIYSRKAGGGRRTLEMYGLRTFVFYVTLRMIGWLTGWTELNPTVAGILPWIDGAMLSLPALLLAVELFNGAARRPAKVIYLTSVSAIYACLLLGASTGNKPLVLWLVLGTALFHAIEYLAIVTHYAWRRRTVGGPAPFQAMAKHWLLVLAAFVVCLGLVASFAERSDFTSEHQWLFEFWVGFNLCTAFLHYAYDGMIWKLRKPATARALGTS